MSKNNNSKDLTNARRNCTPRDCVWQIHATNTKCQIHTNIYNMSKNNNSTDLTNARRNCSPSLGLCLTNTWSQTSHIHDPKYQIHVQKIPTLRISRALTKTPSKTGLVFLLLSAFSLGFVKYVGYAAWRFGPKTSEGHNTSGPLSEPANDLRWFETNPDAEWLEAMQWYSQRRWCDVTLAGWWCNHPSLCATWDLASM